MAKGIPVGRLLCQEIRNCRVLRIPRDEPSLCGAARKTTEGSPEGGTACREASAIKGMNGMERMSGMNLYFRASLFASMIELLSAFSAPPRENCNESSLQRFPNGTDRRAFRFFPDGDGSDRACRSITSLVRYADPGSL